jgi:hypothetical protein
MLTLVLHFCVPRIRAVLSLKIPRQRKNQIAKQSLKSSEAGRLNGQQGAYCPGYLFLDLWLGPRLRLAPTSCFINNWIWQFPGLAIDRVCVAPCLSVT